MIIPQNAPPLFSIVTGFFPEHSPKDPAKGPEHRPLLVCGVRQDPTTSIIFLRIAYGTKQHPTRLRAGDVCVANITEMNGLGLIHPTKFVTHSGANMLIMPYIDEFFRPWRGRTSPVLGMLPPAQCEDLRWHLARATDLPRF